MAYRVIWMIQYHDHYNHINVIAVWYASAVRKAGYLQKLGAKVKSMKQRFFVLSDDALFYYVNESDTKPQGVIVLSTISYVSDKQTDKSTKRDFSFHIATSGVGDNRTFYLYANDEGDKNAWIEAIQGAVFDFSKRNTKSKETVLPASDDKNSSTEWGVFDYKYRNIANEIDKYGVAVVLKDPTAVSDSATDDVCQFKCETTSKTDALRSGVVMRRYSDLSWLQMEIAKAVDDIVVPPLHPQTKYALTDVLAQERERKLFEIFLSRCVRHPKLRFNENVKTFLEAKLNVSDIQKKSKKEALGMKFHNFMNRMSMKNSAGGSTEQSETSSEPWADEWARNLFEAERVFKSLESKSDKFVSCMRSVLEPVTVSGDGTSALVAKYKENVVPVPEELEENLNVFCNVLETIYALIVR